MVKVMVISQVDVFNFHTARRATCIKGLQVFPEKSPLRYSNCQMKPGEFSVTEIKK